MSYRFFFLSLLGVVALSFGCESLRAATFNIANGDVAGLKAAIVASNSNGQDDFINLAAGGTYTLTTIDNSTDGDNGLPVIHFEASHALTINGNGATIQRSTGGAVPSFRIFYMTCGGFCTAHETTINDLTIKNGRAVNSSFTSGKYGAGIFFTSGGDLILNNCVLTGNFASANGGAIENDDGDSLALNNCTLSDNAASTGGGAIDNGSTMDVTDCTFSGNDSSGGPGGAIYNFDGGVQALASFTNCTFDNNGSTSHIGIFNTIFPPNAPVSKITLTHCTLRQTGVTNSGQYTGGPAPTGIITLRNCIFSSSKLVNDTNPGQDRVQIESDGYNLSSDAGGGYLTGPNDQINTDPKLDPAGLQNNGGTTATIALLAESPALDHGNSFGIGLDQRGQFRPRDLASVPNGPGSDGADVGAFEAVDPVQGGPFVVNTTADHDDGVCSATDCTLREAVAATNTATNADTISFASNVIGTITLNAGLGQLTVSNPVRINGPGARVLAVSGGSAIRVFSFGNGSSVLSGLTIRDGRVSAFSSLFSADGGGLINSGTLVVNDCAFTGNQVIGANNNSAGGTGSVGKGGAISNLLGGNLTLNRSTFSGNSATGGKGGNNSGSGNSGGVGGVGQGGALLNDPSCTLAINNCTFANNTATGGVGGNNTSTGGQGGAGGAGSGAAVYNRETIVMTASTISNNTGAGGAGGQGSNAQNNGNSGPGSGGLENSGSSSFTVRNTISAGNSGNGGPNVKGTFISQGYNLIGIGDFGSGFTGPADQVGSTGVPINAKLSPLLNNMGPTDTMALLSDSPAIDQGKSFGLTTDQRSQPRPRDNPLISNASGGDASDIGAFEFGSVLAVTTIDDHNDGVCNAADCTLREAINAANSQAGDEIIGFAPGLSGTIQLTGALPDLSTNMTLQGPGADKISVRRNTGGNYRIFSVSNGTNISGPTVTISGLTLANGQAPAGSYPTNSGGGILNDHGTLTVSECVISGNNSEASNFSYGGGILNNEGDLIVTNTILSNNGSYHGAGLGQRSQGGNSFTAISNSTLSNNAAGGGFGGGFFNGAANSGSIATLTLSNCTLSGNSASGGFAGAIYNAGATGGNGNITLTNCTLSGNSANTGGGIYNFNSSGVGSITLRNSIFKIGATGANLVNNNGTMTSQGSNLSDDAAGGPTGTGPGGFLNATGDMRNTDPQLVALASNGGRTQTHALLATSPAINAGNDANAPSRDQRNYVRSDASDIGSFEFGGKIPATLANISTRAFVQTGDNVVIGGFIITGTGAKKVLIRVRGPSLPDSIANPLQDPTLELHSGPSIIASNDNWVDAANHQEISDSGFAPSNNLESAILMTLNPGLYTAIVSGVSGTSGIGIIEGYDLDHTTGSRFGNISTRAFVQTGDNVMIGGFVIVGPDSDTVIVRATGPSLTAFGVANAMADPTLELHDGNGNTLATNDNWEDTQQAQIQATGFAPSNAAESAILQTLAPGNYTAIVSGKNNTTGTAVVEVFGFN